METKLSLTEEQIIVDRFSIEGFPSTKGMATKFVPANDDTDGSDSDNGGGGSSDEDGS